jgi:hypothetical protein
VLREVRAVDNNLVRSTLARIWARNGENYAALEIDKVLLLRANSQRLPLVRQMPQAKFYSRRALEVGLYEVLNLRKNSPPAARADFKSLEKKALDAWKALDRLLDHMDPGAKCGVDLEHSIVTIVAGVELPNGLDALSVHALARKDGEYLWAAREAIKRLQRGANQRENQVRNARPASTKPEHSVFARVLGECWIFLTNGAPGQSGEPTKNPFLVFLQSAWIDVFGFDEKSDPPDFIGAVRSMSFGEVEIIRIVHKGPTWFIERPQ